MDRIDVLQSLLNQRPKATYLEIGVKKGECLLKLRAPRKIAIDPAFRIKKLRRAWSYLVNPSNFANEYFEITSDAFFAEHADALRGGIDVAFVDGLHTHEQAYRDVCHALEHLKENGVIVMHDCNPASAAAAQFAYSWEEAASHKHPEWNGAWNGDVFKALLQLRAERRDLNVSVLDCDHGLGIVRRGAPEGTLDLSADQITSMTYEEFAPRRIELLNLKPATLAS